MFMELTTSILPDGDENTLVADFSSLLPSIGSFTGAGAIGALLGYGFKKLVKVLLIVLAAMTALIGVPLGYLTYEGVITINWDKL